MTDWWDPNAALPPSNHEFRIYGDDRASSWVVVDEIDYHWLIKHRWLPHRRKSRGNPLKTKTYFRRAVAIYENAQRVRTISLYLHIEIMKRIGIPPPDFFHSLVDHRDGDTFNCQRSNLRWATHSMNSRNLFGREPDNAHAGT